MLTGGGRDDLSQIPNDLFVSKITVRIQMPTYFEDFTWKLPVSSSVAMLQLASQK